MYCNKCGLGLKEGTRFCPNCGEPCVVGSPVVNNSSFQGNYPYTSFQTTGKKNDALFIIIISLVGILAIVVPITINFVNHGTLTPSDTNTATKEENRTINFEGYTVTIPNTVESEIEDGVLYLYDLNNQSGFAGLGIEEGNYWELKENNEYIEDYMESQGYRVGNIETNVYDQVEFTVFLLYEGNNQMILSYALLDEEHFVMIFAANYDGTADEYLLEEIAPIILSMQTGGYNTVEI